MKAMVLSQIAIKNKHIIRIFKRRVFTRRLFLLFAKLYT
jgi:hypothetical protein